MKAFLTATAALALTAAFSMPVQAQQANQQAAAAHTGGPCPISQAITAAAEANEQHHMAATKAKIDALLDAALASPRTAQSAGAPVIMGKGAPNG